METRSYLSIWLLSYLYGFGQVFLDTVDGRASFVVAVSVTGESPGGALDRALVQGETILGSRAMFLDKRSFCTGAGEHLVQMLMAAPQ